MLIVTRHQRFVDVVLQISPRLVNNRVKLVGYVSRQRLTLLGSSLQLAINLIDNLHAVKLDQILNGIFTQSVSPCHELNRITVEPTDFLQLLCLPHDHVCLIHVLVVAVF